MPISKLCPRCGRPVDNVVTKIGDGKLVTGCASCLGVTLGNGYAAKYNRDRQREDYRRDLVQPVDPRAYAKAYPDKARELYGDEAFRKYS